MTQDPPPAHDLINGRYQITRKLGSGGFAVVYAALDTTIEREVAVKILYLPPSLQQTKDRALALERFRMEAKAAARIKHPHIMTIYDMGVIETTQQPYIVMELLSGHDLSDELKRNGPMQPTRAFHLVRQCLDALDAAHKQGIIHKDLKPSNLFLLHPNTPEESICVLDFGIARLEDTGKALTVTGQVMGTPQYMAPEYIEQQSVTPALDVYQMGLILCELLTAHPVMDSPSQLSCISKHLKGEINLPSYLLTTPLAPILLRATALLPQNRYSSASSFKHALDAIPAQSIPHAPTRPLTAASSRPISANHHDSTNEPNHIHSSPLSHSSLPLTNPSFPALVSEPIQTSIFVPAPNPPQVAPISTPTRWPILIIITFFTLFILGGSAALGTWLYHNQNEGLLPTPTPTVFPPTSLEAPPTHSQQQPNINSQTVEIPIKEILPSSPPSYTPHLEPPTPTTTSKETPPLDAPANLPTKNKTTFNPKKPSNSNLIPK